MRKIEKRILDFVALATPINDNHIKPASGKKVDALLSQLNALPVIAAVHERPKPLGISRNSLRHTPWLDREFERKA
jgi:hypothetical protein